MTFRSPGIRALCMILVLGVSSTAIALPPNHPMLQSPPPDQSESEQADVATAPVAQTPPSYANEGFYIGIGLGGAFVSGESKVSFNSTTDRGLQVGGLEGMCTHEYSACARTNYGGGLAALFRLGYNIRGAVAIEAAFIGHGGNLGKKTQEGQGHLSFNAVFHPTGIAKLANPERPINMQWDPYLLIGGGFSYGGYHAKFDDDTKGWEGTDLQFGAGINFRATPHMVVGLDIRITTVFHDTFLFDWGKDISFKPEDDPTSIVTTPMLTLAYHP